MHSPYTVNQESRRFASFSVALRAAGNRYTPKCLDVLANGGLQRLRVAATYRFDHFRDGREPTVSVVLGEAL